jgi:hypothetical protein
METEFRDLVWRLERATASNPPTRAHLQLARSLRRLAVEVGKDTAAADDAYHDVQSAIADLQSRKLRDLRRRLARSRRQGETDEATAARLVRAKAYELGIGRMRCSQHEAERRALADFPFDDKENPRRVMWDVSQLRPAERRAFEIIRGAQRKARKSRIESNAITLADAVIADWKPRPTRARGRPAGSRIALNRKTLALTAVAEVIEVVLPVIDQFASGAASSLLAVKTVIAAIKSAGLTCSLESAARAIHKRRAGADR